MSVAGDSVLEEEEKEELEWRYGASISVRIADCPHTILTSLSWSPDRIHH